MRIKTVISLSSSFIFLTSNALLLHFIPVPSSLCSCPGREKNEVGGTYQPTSVFVFLCSSLSFKLVSLTLHHIFSPPIYFILLTSCTSLPLTTHPLFPPSLLSVPCTLPLRNHFPRLTYMDGIYFHLKKIHYLLYFTCQSRIGTKK